MPYINYDQISNSANEGNLKLKGSSSYYYSPLQNIVIERDAEVEMSTKYIDAAFERGFENIDIEGIRRELKENKEKKKSAKNRKNRHYALNKNKLRKKLKAYSRLPQSRQFLAFYSISFPEKLSDDLAYQAFNTWLTRCRQSEGLRSYVWVAERQKNGTIHFHLITNDYMWIETVNYYMRKILMNFAKKKLIKKTHPLYNGVDVERVTDNFQKLSRYLTKYVSKNDTIMKRLPYHSSRTISRLFTDQQISMKQLKDLERKVYMYLEGDYWEHFILDNSQDILKYNSLMDSANALIYEREMEK